MAYCLVTVGTTLFDDLVVAALEPSFAAALRAQGIAAVRVQLGRGHVDDEPSSDPDAAWERVLHGLRYSFFRLKPSIADDVAGAALVVSHAGAGSIFEALRAGRPLAVVINDSLADNHQQELAEAMASRGHCVQCLPKGLAQAVPLALSPAARLPLPPRDLSQCVRVLDRLMDAP